MRKLIPSLWLTLGLVAALLATLPSARADVTSSPRALLEEVNVVWDSPSTNSVGSMPIGNGDIGLNVWAEKNGDLLFYIGKTDAWSENHRLLKLGRVRVKLTPNPFREGAPFRQELKLRNGEIAIDAGAEEESVAIRVWVDANHPVVHVEMTGESEFEVEVQLEMWRTERRALTEREMHSAYGLMKSPEPVYVEPDEVAENTGNKVVWYHRNERSIYNENLELLNLEQYLEKGKDPLIHRTFGGAILGSGLEKSGSQTLRSEKPQKQCTLSVYPLTKQTETADAWLTSLNKQIQSIQAMNRQERLEAHREWWSDFWERSWIFVGVPEQPVGSSDYTTGYNLWRFMNACGGRGNYPIKFNGSIFNVDTAIPFNRAPEGLDADYRSWGGPYWFQNTRQVYWPMIPSGDFDLMQPLFEMYMDALPLAKEATRTFYGHEGAFFPETMYTWGVYNFNNYGWDREGKPDGLTDNQYIRRYWQGGLELSTMMLDYYSHTGDERFARETLVPFVDEIVTFFDQHWERDEQGQIRFYPAQALESLWDVVNPVPEIAGLDRVLTGMLALPNDLTTAEQRERWTKTLGDLPPLPFKEKDGKEYLAPAEEVKATYTNKENVALYAVFPYRLFGVGKPKLETMRYTYYERPHKGSYFCWPNDNVFAAWLGLADEAATQLGHRMTNSGPFRFTVIYTPGDWPPDGCNGGVSQQALQAMLLQPVRDKLYLFPAWHKDWDVRFKLRAPQETIVEGVYEDGELLELKVTPESRGEDIIKMDPQ